MGACSPFSGTYVHEKLTPPCLAEQRNLNEALFSALQDLDYYFLLLRLQFRGVGKLPGSLSCNP